jgi:small multidrug resistance pump
MSGNFFTFCILFIAVLLETFGTALLYKSDQFTKLWPTLGMAGCYGASFFLLSLTLKSIPVGIAYSIWSALGIVLISLFGWLFFKQTLDFPALIGIVLITTGVVVINLFSNSL